MIDKHAIVEPAGDQRSVLLGEEAVLLNAESRDYFGLTGVGGRIWQLVLEKTSVASIMATIVAEYDVAPADGERDVEQFLVAMAEAGLVRITSTGDGKAV